MTTRQQIVDEARKWLGTRYQHQARVRGRGVDCINLIIGIAEGVGLVPADFNYSEFQGYGRSPNPRILMRGCDRFLDRIEQSEVRQGDILVIRFIDDPQHFALVTKTDPMYMLHSYANARKVTEHIVDDGWMDKVFAAYRFRGLEG